jgi:uncharacterized protein YodC (DUF2158 family)
MLDKMYDSEKVYFVPGDVVTIKHNLPNKPIMLVKGKEQKLIKGTDANHFKGIRCIWFTTLGEMQEAVFSTKDLKFVDTK